MSPYIEKLYVQRKMVSYLTINISDTQNSCTAVVYHVTMGTYKMKSMKTPL